MTRLDLHPGSHLDTAGGEKLGTVRQFVVEPSSSTVTHVLVESGVFFPDDRVVPIETIDHVDHERVILKDAIDPSSLPGFARENYTEVDDVTRAHLETSEGAQYMWRFPTLETGPYPIFPRYPFGPVDPLQATRDDTRDRDLGDRRIIDTSTPVLSIEGEKVGTVEEVHVDEDGRLSHLIVDLGFLSGEKVLPAHWIESVNFDSVRLAVGDSALETLETLT